MLYVTTEFGVPVNVNVAVSFSQVKAGFAVTVAVGNGKTVMVIVLGCGLIQLGVPELATLTIVIKVFAVTTIFVLIVPDAGIVIV